MGERTFVQEASILSGQTFMGYPRRHGFGYRRVVEGDLLPAKNVVDIHARCPTKREHEVSQPRGCSGRARDEVDMGSGLQVCKRCLPLKYRQGANFCLLDHLDRWIDADGENSGPVFAVIMCLEGGIG